MCRHGVVESGFESHVEVAGRASVTSRRRLAARRISMAVAMITTRPPRAWVAWGERKAAVYWAVRQEAAPPPAHRAGGSDGGARDGDQEIVPAAEQGAPAAGPR